MGSGDPGGNVRLHVDRRGAGFGVQLLLLPGLGERGIDSDDVRVHGVRKPRKKGPGPALVSRKNLLPGSHCRRGDPIACRQTGRQPSCHPKADDARGAAPERRIEIGGEVRALTANDGNARTERNASL